MIDFSEEEIKHYQRHLSLAQIGISGQKKLKNASVLIVGAGGLGCPALLYLTAAGVGKIGIVDDDAVEPSNLQRQILFDYEDLGKPKAEVAASRLSAKNPFVEFVVHQERLVEGNVEEILAPYSLVVDGSDNFPTRYLVNDACAKHQKTLVHGSIFEFSGQVSVFNYKSGPTYRCLFPEPPTSNALPSCAEAGVMGILPGIIGSVQAVEAIKVITEVGEVLSGKLWLYDALSQKAKIVRFKKNSTFDYSQPLAALENSCPSGPVEDSSISEISPDGLHSMLTRGTLDCLIDVREEWEREISRIDPSVHLPLSRFSMPSSLVLPKKINKFSKIGIYCKAGIRSKSACETLASMGYLHLYNLDGGMLAWEDSSRRPTCP